MKDVTENARRNAVKTINSQVESNDENIERKRLEDKHGQVWDTAELQNDFEALGFAAPFIIVKRKSDNAKGSLTFQHMPRFYFDFRKA